MSQRDPVFPHTVGEVVGTSLDAFFSAAALHLGEPDREGRKLKQPDPIEAWLAMISASAVLMQLRPIMTEPMRAPYEGELRRLAERFARLHPDVQVPAPGLSGANLAAAPAAPAARAPAGSSPA
ncbi:MAG: hypothetical protein JWM80_2594 [Cyanobacteria bacterium RYN_339]|nr:hypothetical protein [Cyanobacteria bacterium RYN_339]